jgi:predicted enzyme related to lactoylglutathione lyase
MANPVVQFQILSKRPDETAQFYGDLFGWTVTRIIRWGTGRSQPDPPGHPGRHLAGAAAGAQLRATLHRGG